MRRLTVLFFLLTLLVSCNLLFAQDYPRKKVDVPSVPAGSIKIDGKMDETAWTKAAKADIMTTTGSNGFFNGYYPLGESLKEPDYKSIYGRMLWSKDTLYLFYHVQEVKTDSTGLYFGKKFEADQIFVSLSNRLGIEELETTYNGAPYTAPNGPYHYWVLGDKVTLNGGDSTWIPEEYRGTYKGLPADSMIVYDAKNFARWATRIDTTTATWDLEMAIYHPNIKSQSSIGCNVGGAQGSRIMQNAEWNDRTYSYYCWQPNTPNQPMKDPVGGGDPGYWNLVNSKYWAVLNFVTSTVGVEDGWNGNIVPAAYELRQNYPNPFNPTTTIQFAVPKFGPVTLKVYNIVGQEVATLVNGREMAAGKYAVTWNAKNMASGVYFYNLEANGVKISKKMMLLK